MCVQYIGGYHEFIGGCSAQRVNTMSTLGDIQYIRDVMSTSRDVQYTGGYHDASGG